MRSAKNGFSAALHVKAATKSPRAQNTPVALVAHASGDGSAEAAAADKVVVHLGSLALVDAGSPSPVSFPKESRGKSLYKFSSKNTMCLVRPCSGLYTVYQRVPNSPSMMCVFGKAVLAQGKVRGSEHAIDTLTVFIVIVDGFVQLCLRPVPLA